MLLVTPAETEAHFECTSLSCYILQISENRRSNYKQLAFIKVIQSVKASLMLLADFAAQTVCVKCIWEYFLTHSL